MRFQKLIIAFALFLLVGSFLLRGITLLDPDFGWHLKMGELISTAGRLPETDPFSYTMPSFSFIDHEWLTNLIIFKLYPFLGVGGLAILTTLISLSALAIAIVNPLSRKAAPGGLGFWRKTSTAFLLGAGVLILYSGVRPQVVSWLFLAILLWLILNEAVWRRLRFVSPLFFVLWVNLHASFSAGLATLYLVLILRAVRQRRVDIKDLIAAISSLLATFVNPYGPRIWQEVWLQVSDASLRWTIIEWMPAPLFFNVPLLFLIALSLLLLIKYRRRFYLEEKGLYLAFLIQGTASVTHIPLWVVVTLPLLSLSTDYFFRDLRKIPFGISRFAKSYKFALLASLLIFTFEAAISLSGAGSLAETAFYPYKAVSYLRQQLPGGQILSSYNWGGYLIWKLPEKKVFIDGRMPSWRWEANLANESNYAMKDYKALLNGEVFYQEIFEKYGIETVLWPVPRKIGFWGYLEDRLNRLLTQFGGKYDFDLIKELKEAGWEEIYSDQIAAVYQRPD